MFIFFSDVTEDSKSSTHESSFQVGEMDEAKRRFLREVELKVMKYADKLEMKGISKSGETFKNELEKFRENLIEVISFFLLKYPDGAYFVRLFCSFTIASLLFKSSIYFVRQEYDRSRRKRGRDRKRDRSHSSSPVKTPSRNVSSPRRRKSNRSRSISPSDSVSYLIFSYQ